MTLVCPEMSVEGENLFYGEDRISCVTMTQRNDYFLNMTANQDDGCSCDLLTVTTARGRNLDDLIERSGRDRFDRDGL